MTETKQVLLVDDDELLRTIVADMVRDAGFDPVVASSAKEAIGSLATLQPLAALVDLYMPDGFGDECCKIIKGNEDLCHVPVVMITASADDEVQRAFLAGADDFLAKPVRPFQLTTKLHAARDGLRRPPRLTQQDTAMKRVLIADDDGFFGTLVGNLLDRAGYEVVRVETGLSALRIMLLGRPQFDMCMLNASLPGIGGLELVRKLRAYPQFSKLPIFVISRSGQSPSVLEELRDLGILHFIQKDALNAEDLLKKVNAQFYRGREARVVRRARFCRICDFRCPGDNDWLSGFTYNLSAGGVGLRTLTPLTTGAVAEIRFNFTPRLKCETKARVAWSNEFNPGDASTFPYGMGLQFSETNDEWQEWIGRYLNTTLET